MISLNLGRIPKEADPETAREVSIDDLERRAGRLMTDLSIALAKARHATAVIPSDLLFHAVDALMPPERMGVIAGRVIRDTYLLGTLYDVTGHGHQAHVSADPEKLGKALIAFEQAGAKLAGWIHSHPGSGANATTPSSIDRNQYAEWIRDYDPLLIGLIVVRDGFVRLWGDAIESGALRVEIAGPGLRRVKGGGHVFELVR